MPGSSCWKRADRLPASPVNGATAVVEQYVWSACYVDSPIETDRTVSTYSTAGGGSWSAATDQLYYLTDANDNVTAVTDASGVVQERYSYDAYGHVTVYNANWSQTGTTSAVGNTVLFAGMDLDPTTGLYYDGARWYNPSTGGYMSRDPAQSSANLYEYCGDDPTGAVDPTGLYAGRRRDRRRRRATPAHGNADGESELRRSQLLRTRGMCRRATVQREWC